MSNCDRDQLFSFHIQCTFFKSFLVELNEGFERVRFEVANFFNALVQSVRIKANKIWLHIILTLFSFQDVPRITCCVRVTYSLILIDTGSIHLLVSAMLFFITFCVIHSRQSDKSAIFWPSSSAYGVLFPEQSCPLYSEGRSMDFDYSPEENCSAKSYGLGWRRIFPKSITQKRLRRLTKTLASRSGLNGRKNCMPPVWSGAHWPKEYGGRGATVVEQAIYQQDMARVRAPGVANPLGISIVGPTLIHWGTEEQKRATFRPSSTAKKSGVRDIPNPVPGRISPRCKRAPLRRATIL